jgi:ABC-type transport system involved in cytochrome c biogenesis permease subunit
MIATFCFIGILVAAIVQVVYLFRKDEKKDPYSIWLLGAAAAGFLGITVARSISIGFIALTSTYESLLFYSAFIMALVVAYRYQRKLPYSRIVAFGATVGALVLAAIASSPLLPKEALPPIPALRSFWLVLHVALSFVGEAFFVISFVSAIAFLATRDEKKKLEFDRITYTAIAVGYPVFTAGALIFGAIWAEQAWGRWWSWDPKETWALITWLVYTIYLHVRLVMKKKDATASWIAVVGFLCTVFTFFGVNYLLPGLHSYG